MGYKKRRQLTNRLGEFKLEGILYGGPNWPLFRKLVKKMSYFSCAPKRAKTVTFYVYGLEGGG
jgi:hypothetical protein